jgi:hypothetical protein
VWEGGTKGARWTDRDRESERERVSDREMVRVSERDRERDKDSEKERDSGRARERVRERARAGERENGSEGQTSRRFLFIHNVLSGIVVRGSGTVNDAGEKGGGGRCDSGEQRKTRLHFSLSDIPCVPL